MSACTPPRKCLSPFSPAASGWIAATAPSSWVSSDLCIIDLHVCIDFLQLIAYTCQVFALHSMCWTRVASVAHLTLAWGSALFSPQVRPLFSIYRQQIKGAAMRSRCEKNNTLPQLCCVFYASPARRKIRPVFGVRNAFSVRTLAEARIDLHVWGSGSSVSGSGASVCRRRSSVASVRTVSGAFGSSWAAGTTCGWGSASTRAPVNWHYIVPKSVSLTIYSVKKYLLDTIQQMSY